MKLMTTDLVALDADLGATKAEVIESLAGLVAADGRADAAGLTRDAMEREGKAATGLPGGFAIPHCRSAAVAQSSLAFARLSQPVDFGAKDGPADLVFLIAAAEGGDADHLKLLTKLARALVKKEFLASLRDASSREEVVTLVDAVLEPAPQPAVVAAAPATSPAAGETAAAPAEQPLVVAITACPTGIAHTFMAADHLVNAGKEMGVEVQVETQGSGAVTPLPGRVIRNAAAVIFATDVGVKDRERFAGLPVIESGVKRAINEPAKMLEEALAAANNPNARRVSGDASAQGGDEGATLGWGKRIQQALMTGVSYMIPFVAAGGLLIALSFLFGGYDITDVADGIVTSNTLFNLPDGGLMAYLGAVLFKVGATAFGFLVPALSGYIAYALAGRPGIAPGFVGGAVSVAVGAGFIGGLITGLIAGFVALWIGSLKAPRWLAGLMPVVIIPLVATLITGGAMYFLLGRPLAAVTEGLTNWLNGLSGGSAVLLGVILGLMMCFDLGGPVNKAAYLFATAGLSAETDSAFMIMAAVMAAGMVPPLAMALSTTVRPKLYTEPEIENGRAAWLLGASFISEGAIPFAAADLARVVPSMMLGGAVTGALSMALEVGSRAPHGGIFVLFAISNVPGFIISIVAGTLVAALAVTFAKELRARKNIAPVAVAA